MKDTTATSIHNYGVQFLNEDIGFVVGAGNKRVSAFYKTTDGGDSWSKLIGDPNLINELKTLHFFDENNGVVAGDESTLAYTTDSGLQWNKITPIGIPNEIPSGQIDYDRITFLNETFGLAAGDILIKSTDAGKTWEYVNVPNLPDVIYGVAIVDELTWYLTGTKYLFKTTDGGVTWSNIIDLEIVTSWVNSDVHVDDDGNPWIVCDNSEIYTMAPEVNDVARIGNNIIDILL